MELFLEVSSVQRWENLANTYGCDAAVFELNWGSSVDLDVFETWVSKLDTLKAFSFKQTKASTGVAYPVNEIVSLVKKHHKDAVVVVDAISALLAQDLNQKKLNIDVLLSGSQKASVYQLVFHLSLSLIML